MEKLKSTITNRRNRTKEQAGPGGAGSLLRRTGAQMDFFDDFKTMTVRRKNMTQVHGSAAGDSKSQGQRPIEFLDLVSLICDIYQSYAGSLLPMQQFHSSRESEEDAGNSCIVTSRSISSPAPSSTVRGEVEMSQEKIIVKRTKKGIFGTQSSALRSLISELRIRAHPPLRSHPNIVDLKGVAWDFENDDEKKPRPLLIEEFAIHRSLETFWEKENLVRMPFKVKANLCKDIAEGISALHACGVVHGDVKPGNILIFNATGDRGPFMAKLTDFGHSVCRFEGRQSLPAWTPSWSAPEADPNFPTVAPMSFDDMAATDIYSYGLVLVSITIGTSIFSDKFSEFKDANSVARMKVEDTLMEHAMNVVTQEDQTQLDSDFDLVVINSLLRCSLVKTPADRSLAECLMLLQRSVAYLCTQSCLSYPAHQLTSR